MCLDPSGRKLLPRVIHLLQIHPESVAQIDGIGVSSVEQGSLQKSKHGDVAHT